MDFMTRKQAADFIGVTEQYVSRMIYNKRIKAEKIGDCMWAVDRKSAQDFKAARDAKKGIA